MTDQKPLTEQQLDEIEADRAILATAPRNSDDWDDETWAAWWRTAERVHGEHADTEVLRARADACAEGDCPHAYQARSNESEASRYRHELEGLADYLEDRDGIDPAVAVTLRGILARALDR